MQMISCIVQPHLEWNSPPRNHTIVLFTFAIQRIISFKKNDVEGWFF